MYVRGYLQGSENGRVITIDYSISLCYTRNIVQLNSLYIKFDSKHFFLKKIEKFRNFMKFWKKN